MRSIWVWRHGNRYSRRDLKMLSLNDIDILTGGKIGRFDLPCPICSPEKSAAGQKRKVMRLWRASSTYATYYCARCELSGYARDGTARRPDAGELVRARLEAQRFTASVAEDRRRKARWLWSRRRPIQGTPAERYLREARGYNGALAPTLGFLPGSSNFSAALISAFAFPSDAEHIEISAGAIQAVHLTRLAPDGSAKAGTETDKLVIGTPRGTPIVLAPITDGLGLVIAEGIEDALSVHEATGSGAWAAASAPLLSHLVATVPDYVECVTCVVDDDKAGRRNSAELAAGLESRGIEVRLFYPARSRLAAA